MKQSRHFRLWVRKQLIPRCGPFLAWVAIRLLAATMRFRVHDEEGLLERHDGKPRILVFWHNRILLMPYLYRRYYRNTPLVVMISESRDGEMIARVAEKFGIEAARGSTSGRGASALIRMHRALARVGKHVGITPDGPRGPRYVVQPGVLHLAQNSGLPVIPISTVVDRKWEARSWDRFQIPKPFSRCDVFIRRAIPADHSDLVKAIKNSLGD